MTTKPWLTEPNRDAFEAYGFQCRIERSQLGTLCGYVAVPKWHPWRRLAAGSIPARPHGGITWVGAQRGSRLHWLGFDCGHPHLGDLIPALYSFPLPSLRRLGGTYRTIAYVRRETRRLAAQAAKAARSHMGAAES